jgi:four helix bundle protein
MFLHLQHQNLRIHAVSKELVLECYRISKLFPPEERFAITQQIRRASLSVYLNICEGCSRKSESERKRYFEISRGSVIETDAALEICVDLNYINKQQLEKLGTHLIEAFKLLSSLLK